MLINTGRFLLSITLLLFAVAVHAQTPTASISCPATAFVGEPVICDGSGSTGVNGKVGWSATGFADGSAAVDWDYGDNQGAYSHSTLLKGPHVYFTAGTYTVTLKVKNSSGVQSSPATATITISDIPAATAGNFQTLADKGSNSANCTELQTAIDNALAANTVEKEIRLPAITYPCALTARAYVGTKYVTIRPADMSWLPGPLKRISPTLASNMPKIQAPGVDQTPVTIGGAGRGYIRFLGIEFNRPFSGHLQQFITIGSSPTTYADLPTHIIIDRCYFHGNTLDNTVRTVFINADSFSFINNYTTDIHAVGEEAQGLAGFAGDGIAIARNYIEGYSQQVLFGGADSGIKFSATCASGTSPTGCTLSASPSNLRVGDGISFAVGGGRGPWSASIVRSISGNNITFDQITNQSGTPTAPDTTTNAVRYGASPQDILFAQNSTFKSLFYKCTDNPVEGQPCIPDPAYNGSYKPVVKNIFELKHAMRVIVVGNVMQNHWGQQGQSGPSVLFTPRNQTCYLVTFPHDPVTCPEQVNPWAMVRDVSFEHNKVLNVADFVNITGTDNLNPPGTGDEAGPSAFTQYIRVANNLVTTNASGMNGGGAMAFIFPGARHIRFSHNTEVDPGGGGYIIGSTAAPIGNTATDVVIVNNIAKHLTYGALGDGRFAKDFVAYFFPDGAINYNVFSDDTNNVGPNGELWNTTQTSPTYFPATIGTNTFASLSNCLAGTSCQLSSTSPYKAGNATPAADGLDMGVNDADVAAVTANTTSGDWSGGPQGTDFVTDTFTEASDTTLASHTGEVGATWTLHPSYSGAALDNGSLKRVYLNTSATAAYYASGVPPSANYCVQADFNRVTQNSNNISIVIGMDTAADAGLLLRGNDNGTTFQWEVIDRAGGSNTLLTSSSADQPAIGGAAVTMKMCRNGTSVTVFANGTQNTALNATTTTTAVGKAGIRASGQATSTTGIHLDNFHAQ